MKSKDKSLNILITLSILNAILRLLGNDMNIIRYALLFFEFIIILLCDEKKILPLLLFLHPNSATYDDIGFTYLFNFSLMILMIKLLFVTKWKVDKKITSLFLLILCLEFILILKSGYIDKGLFSMVSWISSYFILIIYSKKMEFLDFSICYKYFFAGFIVGAIGGMVYPLATWGIKNIPTAYRFTGLLRDPNYYCIDALLLIFSANTYAKLNNKKEIFYIIVIFSLGILSVSKTFIILFVLGCILKVLINIKSLKPLQIIKISSVCGIFLLILFKLNYIDLFMEKYLYRTETTTLFTGRDELFAYYINVLFNNPINVLFGNSLLKYPYIFDVGSINEFYTNFVAHNTYLDLILSWGIIGTIIYIIFMYYICTYTKKEDSKNKDFKILLIIILCALLVLSYLSADFFAVMILFLLMLRRVDNSNI